MRKTTLGLFLVFITLNQTYAVESIFDRASRAEQKCGLSSLAKPEYTAPDADMMRYYKPSTTQRILTPFYTTVFDRFGGVVQGMISGKEEAYVAPTLERLGRFIAKQSGLTKENKVCMATCMVNYLMEGQDDVIPYTSMTLAVARGKGFCRHFSLATKKILKSAGVRVQTETAFEHMFLKLNLDGVLHYQDPMNENGRWSCTFFPAHTVR